MVDFVGDRRTCGQMAPSATRKVPFITPSRCAASPMRTLAKCCSTNPVSSPSRNKHIPCHIRRRLVCSMPSIFSFCSRNTLAPNVRWLLINLYYAQNAQSRDSDFNVLGGMDVTKVLSLPVLCIPPHINED